MTMLANSINPGLGSRSVYPQPCALDFFTQVIDQTTLEHPDERQLMRGIESTDVPAHLQSMVDSLVWESSRTEEGSVHSYLHHAPLVIDSLEAVLAPV